jgi:hypothetical protein
MAFDLSRPRDLPHSLEHANHYNNGVVLREDNFWQFLMRRTQYKGVGMIRVDFGPISEIVYIDIILNTIIER